MVAMDCWPRPRISRASSATAKPAAVVAEEDVAGVPAGPRLLGPEALEGGAEQPLRAVHPEDLAYLRPTLQVLR